ncbi:MAG: dihydrodipicolinate synthase family protein [Planctomycetes bacterium]|nr:dihydrodipicolinate synthase family protein [Planctomycetota bacterium]MCB9935708.1 dihydrodipicolinate synthase family protein [Planctomycetota bacterium]
MYLPEGAFAPVPTPLTGADAIDAAALGKHLAWLKAEGLAGALILGTNGEFASLTLAERRAVAEAAARADSGLKLLLNVGSCALPEALELAELGAGLGYDALLCPPPFYHRNAPVGGLAAFFGRLLDASKLPVLLYHIPQMTGIAISDELLDAIGPHDNLAGIKDSTGDEDEMNRLLPRFAQRSYLVGNDKLVAKSYELGGRGSISACASVVPDLVVRIRSKPDQQAKLNSVRGMLEKFGLGGAVKAILRKKGFGDYATRPPLNGLDEAKAEQLFGMLNMFGAIKW